MIKTIRTLGLGLAAAAVFAAGSAPRPATADTISTLAAAIATIGSTVLFNNYQHKEQAANQVVGYTRNGGSIYGDGRIVMPNGQTFYPNANGQYSWGQYAYYTSRFNGNAVAYDPSRSGQFDRTHHHDNGLHRGWYKNDAPAHVNAYVPQTHHEVKHEENKHEDRGHGDDQGQRNEGHDDHDKGHGHDH